MTWNVWGRFGDRWLRRQRAIAETVRAQRPDFVALQETWHTWRQSQTELLGFEFGMSPVFAPSRMPRDPDPDVRLGLGILSRFPLREVQQHSLSADTIALRAEIRLGDKSLHFVTSCLDWEEDHEAERRAQAGCLADLVRELRSNGDEVVVAGETPARTSRYAEVLFRRCLPPVLPGSAYLEVPATIRPEDVLIIRGTAPVSG